MKALIRTLFVMAFFSALVVACGDKKGGGGNDDYLYDYDPFDGGYYNSKSERYQGVVQITDRNLYQKYLKQSGFCSTFIINGCKQIDKSPLLSVLFQDNKVNLVNGVGAQIVIDVMSDWGYPTGAAPYPTRFYRVNQDTQLEAQVFGYMGTSSYNGQIRVVLSGKIKDATMTGELYYREGRFGVVSLGRAPKVNPYQNGYNNGYNGNGYNNGYYPTYPY